VKIPIRFWGLRRKLTDKLLVICNLCLASQSSEDDIVCHGVVDIAPASGTEYRGSTPARLKGFYRKYNDAVLQIHVIDLILTVRVFTLFS
jgi:hypothetical protein